VTRAIGWISGALIYAIALGYLLAAGDSGTPVRHASDPAPPNVAALVLVAQAQAGEREFYVSHRQVIPVGSWTIFLPILMYHYVRTPPSTRTDLLGYRLSVSPEDFNAQMDWLKASRYHPVDFNDVRAYFAGTRPLPENPVVITLDDGYRDLYTTAFPILAAHRFKAVAYIVSSFVGQSRYVTREQVVEMDRGGIEIASHTVDHANLARSSYGSIMFQLVQSKRWLEDLVGHPVVDFAYPSGQFNSQVVAALKVAGYDTAVTEQTSTVHTPDDRYTWARVRVGGGESLGEFIANLGPQMRSITLTDVQVEPATDAPPAYPDSDLQALRPGYK
jgi:peptidoglycan/xylan/chitin deacetylase (PgdA/CDA1 family)